MLALLLSACEQTPSGPSSGSASLERAYFGSDDVRWFRHDSAGAWTMQPLLDSSRVYFERDLTFGPAPDYAVTSPSRMIALDRSNGSVIWSRPIVTGYNAAIAGSLVATVWGSLPTFDRSSGVPGPVFAYETSLTSNVASDGARYYVGAYDGRLLAVNPTAATVAWSASVAESQTSVFGVTVAGAAVIATGKWFAQTTAQRDSGFVLVVERATGAVRWRYVMPSDSLSSAGIVLPAVVVGDLVIVTTQRQEVRALDLATGAVRWRYDASSPDGYGSEGLASCDGNVIAATADLGLVSLRASDGQVNWRLPDERSGSLLMVDCAHGTVQARGSYLTIYDAASGARLRRYPEQDLFGPEGEELYVTSVTRDESTLYIGTIHGFAAVAAP